MLDAGPVNGQSSSIAQTWFLSFHNCDSYIDSGDFPNPAQGCRTSASFAPHPVESGSPLDNSLRRHPLSIDYLYGVHSPDTFLKGFGYCRVSGLRSLILLKANNC
jgi:hypothetical protein